VITQAVSLRWCVDATQSCWSATTRRSGALNLSALAARKTLLQAILEVSLDRDMCLDALSRRRTASKAACATRPRDRTRYGL
jgi:hypothetical protein